MVIIQEKIETTKQNMMERFSDLDPIKTQPTNGEESYIIEEAKLYLDETALSSIWGPNKHVDNVVALGRKNTPFLMELVKENDHPQGMYAHFLIDVMFALYKDEIDNLGIKGHLGVDGCMKLLIKMYNKGLIK